MPPVTLEHARNPETLKASLLKATAKGLPFFYAQKASDQKPVLYVHPTTTLPSDAYNLLRKGASGVAQGLVVKGENNKLSFQVSSRTVVSTMPTDVLKASQKAQSATLLAQHPVEWPEDADVDEAGQPVEKRTLYASDPRKMVVEDPHHAGQYREIDTPGHEPGAIYTEEGNQFLKHKESGGDLVKESVGTYEEFEQASLRNAVEELHHGHSGGYTSQIRPDDSSAPKLQTTIGSDGKATKVEDLDKPRLVFHPGRHSAGLSIPELQQRLTRGRVPHDSAKGINASTTSQFLTDKHWVATFNGAVDALRKHLPNLPTTPDSGTHRLFSAYTLVIEYSAKVGRSFTGTGGSTSTTPDEFGELPPKQKSYSSIGGEVDCVYVQTTFNVDESGDWSCAQHYPLPAVPTGAFTTLDSTTRVRGNDFGVKKGPPIADPDKLPETAERTRDR